MLDLEVTKCQLQAMLEEQVEIAKAGDAIFHNGITQPDDARQAATEAGRMIEAIFQALWRALDDDSGQTDQYDAIAYDVAARIRQSTGYNLGIFIH